MKYLLLYSSTDGHTKKIVQSIGDELSKRNGVICRVESLDPPGQDYNLKEYSKVLVGASIRYGHFKPSVYAFASKHSAELNAMPSAFFCVNLTARKPNKRTPESNAYARNFLKQTPWNPTLSGVFAGALFYPRYTFVDRVMIQFIMLITGGETDASKEIVYTDWNAVGEFANSFAALTNNDVTVAQAAAVERRKELERQKPSAAAKLLPYGALLTVAVLTLSVVQFRNRIKAA